MVVVAIRQPVTDSEAAQGGTAKEISGAVVSAGGEGGGAGGGVGVGVVVVAVEVAELVEEIALDVAVVFSVLEGLCVAASDWVGEVLPSTMPMPPLLAPLAGDLVSAILIGGAGAGVWGT